MMAQPRLHLHSSLPSYINQSTFQLWLINWLCFCSAKVISRFLNHEHEFLFNFGFCVPVNSSFHSDKASSTRFSLEALWGSLPARTGGVIAAGWASGGGTICKRLADHHQASKRAEGEMQTNRISRLILPCILVFLFCLLDEKPHRIKLQCLCLGICAASSTVLLREV